MCGVYKKRPAIGVCGSQIGPFSYAICARCLKLGAEPLDKVKIKIRLMGGISKFPVGAYDIVTFADGRYATVGEVFADEIAAFEEEKRQKAEKMAKKKARMARRRAWRQNRRKRFADRQLRLL